MRRPKLSRLAPSDRKLRDCAIVSGVRGVYEMGATDALRGQHGGGLWLVTMTKGRRIVLRREFVAASEESARQQAEERGRELGLSWTRISAKLLAKETP